MHTVDCSLLPHYKYDCKYSSPAKKISKKFVDHGIQGTNLYCGSKDPCLIREHRGGAWKKEWGGKPQFLLFPRGCGVQRNWSRSAPKRPRPALKWRQFAPKRPDFPGRISPRFSLKIWGLSPRLDFPKVLDLNIFLEGALSGAFSSPHTLCTSHVTARFESPAAQTAMTCKSQQLKKGVFGKGSFRKLCAEFYFVFFCVLR